MKLQLQNRTLLILVLIFAAGTLSLGYLVYHQSNVKNLMRKETLKSGPFFGDLDREISLGAYQSAEKRLMEAAENSESGAFYLQLAKRALTIASITGNYQTFESLVKTGSEKFSGMEELSALYGYALLRRGDYTSALEVTGSLQPFTRDITRSIHNEALLAAEADRPGDPSGYNREFLEELALELDSARLLVNSLLLALVEEPGIKALEIADRLREGFGSDNYSELEMLLFQVYADLSRYDSALQILQAESSLDEGERALLTADIQLKTGDRKGAIKTYKDYVELFPDQTWQPYINLQLLEEQDTFWLDKGFTRFPENKDFLIEAALVSSRQDYNVQTVALIEAYQEAGGDSPLAFLLMERSRGAAKPERYRTLVLRMMESAETGKSEAKHGIWFFYGLRSDKEIERIGSYATQLWGKEGWSIFSSALSLFLQGNHLAASELFLESWNEDSDLWEAAYNSAIILRAKGRSAEARQRLQMALSSVPAADKRFLAVIYTRIAELELHGGNRNEASRMISMALEADPQLAQARSFKSSLDAEAP
jgi:tetratricopeptide (TPR) repeat protein